MAIRMTYITYTPEAHRAIIEGKQNREPVMRALIEDAGGKFIGFYGLIGRPEGDGVVISDFANLSDYMSVVAKTMLSGAISDITTAHCYTGEDVVAASTKAAAWNINRPHLNLIFVVWAGQSNNCHYLNQSHPDNILSSIKEGDI